MRCVQKPWGYYRTLISLPDWKLKVLFIAPKQSTSLQRHRHRSESWIIAKGTGRSYNEQYGYYNIKAGETVEVPVGWKHRLINRSKKDYLVVVEVWRGRQLSEGDIERFEDDYGRV